EGTTFEFKTPVDTATDGEKDATVVVTYPDGSKDEVPVKVTVKTPSTDADKYTPVAKEQNVNKGETPDAKGSIGNVGELPEGTTFEFKTPVDTATDGEKDATVVVTYPDGSKDEVPVKVTVKDSSALTQPEITTDLTGKAGTKTPVEVTADPGSKVELYDKDGNKIGEATAGEDGKATITPTVDIPEGNVTVVSSKDGQTPEASDPVQATAATPETPAKPSKPVVTTDLTGKAGTKTPVEVTADPGTKVELFDKDGYKIGEGVTGEDGKVTITPTVDIAEGDVTAKATNNAGKVSEASDPAKATSIKDPATPATPTQPEITTDLTGKAGTKTPVEVTADPGSKVELYDKDGNKIGEATAGEDGKATITPTVDIPEGNVTVVSSKDGQTPEASDPVQATAATPETPAKPSKPVVTTDLTGKAGTKTPVEVTADPGTKVELFDKDGNKIGEGVTGEDGKASITPTVEIPAGPVTAKASKDGKTSDESAPKVATKDPAITPVVNPSALTDAEKAKVVDEVKKANPTASKVEVGNDGTATVTFPDGSVAVLTPEKTVKEADSNGVKNPAITPVVNPSALTDAEKAKVADEVKKANPTASKVEVGNDGTATVTFPDGSVAVLTPEKTVKEADSNGVKNPAITPVVNPSALTDAEKAKVADEVKK
ncbi:Rib/alpha-like domain-containing protein, partial [Streptococcus infantis]|uniref:Rib/alpha-like domain-containing protein n=2 Tax=Streptococcus infantis TaxID=68892 RepID=UPI0039C2ADC4